MNSIKYVVNYLLSTLLSTRVSAISTTLTRSLFPLTTLLLVSYRLLMRKYETTSAADDSITLRTERVVGKKIEFNEVLSVLYREGQKMSWHDDGEPGMLL